MIAFGAQQETEKPFLGYHVQTVTLVQGPTDLWYRDRLGRARARQSGILNALQPPQRGAAPGLSSWMRAIQSCEAL